MISAVRPALLVARREFVQRATSKAFIFSNLILILALLVAIALPAFVGDGAPLRLGYTPEAEPAAQLAAQQAPALGLELELVPVADPAGARAALDGSADTDPADAVLLAPDHVLVRESLPGQLESVLTSTARALQLESVLADADVPAEQQAALRSPPELQVDAVSPGEGAEQGPALVVGAIAVFALYGLLMFYGQFVAMGIVEEKSSRVVELLLSTIRPTSLLYGKVLGLTALGVAQTMVLGATGLGAAALLLDVQLPAEAVPTVALAVAWFLLGFLLYATLFAVGASLVSRQEDLSATVFPVFIPIFVGFFVAQASLQDPDSTVSLVAGLVPLTAPLVQPLRFGAQVVAPWEVPVAVGLCCATIAVLIPVAARFYSGSVLRFGGRVGLREAWRAARS